MVCTHTPIREVSNTCPANIMTASPATSGAFSCRYHAANMLPERGNRPRTHREGASMAKENAQGAASEGGKP